jgi:hypothetical protein
LKGTLSRAFMLSEEGGDGSVGLGIPPGGRESVGSRGSG